MSKMPLAHVIQWQALLAIDRGAQVTYNARTLGDLEERKRKQIMES